MYLEEFKKDYFRAFPNHSKISKKVIRNCHEIGYIYWSRKYSHTKSALYKKIIIRKILRYRKITGLELNLNNVGGGLYLVHPWNITMHTDAIIGENATLFKGVTIGIISKGKRKGVPRIGKNVTIYANATVCGNINVGDNVIICANAFVNFDVPDNSVVIGNPGVIHQGVQEK